MSGNEEDVAKLKDQLARAMRGYQLLKQQAEKQAGELAEEKQRSADLEAQQGDQDLSEQLELSNAKLEESTMQLESVKQELEQQQQQSADRISSLNKRLESKELAQNAAVETAIKQERDAFEAAQVLHEKAEKELVLLRQKVVELEDSTMVKAEESMSAMSRIEDLEEKVRVAIHSVDLSKAELAMRDKELEQTRDSADALKSAKRLLEERVNEVEQQLTFTSQDRDRFSQEKKQLDDAEKESSGKLSELQKELGAARDLHRKEMEEVTGKLQAAEADARAAKEEVEAARENGVEQLAACERLRGEMAELESVNSGLCDRVDGFDKQLEDQASQHKLDQKKNVKAIRELKGELLKAVEQKKRVEAELCAAMEATPPSGHQDGLRNRSSTVGNTSPTSRPQAEILLDPAPATPDSLNSQNFKLEIQLEEAQEELQRKEEMLEFYMKSAPTCLLYTSPSPRDS
eukprot:TRINITY_DN14492_c0_g1_i4.p1 TRINITY_DN14492_c0_g1~~TRINITY_DN14492_c0_g1_i4.p1  ORF type:complete len:461 (-),score=176.08 TRINITY_DN14492_c0_g1_i4:103-1485(-)